MKALSIKQPWASLIAHGIKDIENRTWKTHFRGRIYIHSAAKSMFNNSVKQNYEGFKQLGFFESMIEDANNKLFGFMNHQDLNITSAIIGEVDIVDCVVNHPSIWAEKTHCPYSHLKPIYNWVLANPVLYEKPIVNVKGKLSFWETDYCHCEVCQKPFHIETMIPSEDNWICEECLNEDLAKIEEM